MLPRSGDSCQNDTWQRALADAFTEPAELLAYLGLSSDDIPDFDAAPGFRMRVPRGYADLMQRGNPQDPLLRQVLPVIAERAKVAGFVTDPVGDGAADRGQGVLQKYAGRALFVTTGACALHCRYCFRRHFPYAGPIDPAAAEVVAQDDSVTKVILSGGDPLMLGDDRLEDLISNLEAIPHLRRLRIHSRVPVVLPQRITEHLVRRLAESHLAVVMVVHANHPNELGEGARTAMELTRSAGIHLLNQSVLLRGINDSPDALAGLSERLFEMGVLPYYLHQLDPVEGGAHFQVSDDDAKGLVTAIRGRLPGYLVPRLVRELPGAAAKIGMD